MKLHMVDTPSNVHWSRMRDGWMRSEYIREPGVSGTEVRYANLWETFLLTFFAGKWLP